MSIKKFKKCILHIGSPKTGTTSIQSYFYNNRTRLEQSGYLYPPRANHIFLVSNFSANPAGYDFNKKKGRVTEEKLTTYHDKEMKALEESFLKTDAHTLVISSEYFINAPLDMLKGLKTYLDPWVDKFEIVCYIRHPISNARSNIQQHIKAGFSKFHEQKLLHIQKLSNILSCYSSVFGKTNISLREFNPNTLHQQNVVSDFAHKMGLAETLIDKMAGGFHNESTSVEALLIYSAITEQFPRTKDKKWNPERAKVIGASNVQGQKFLLTKEQIRAVNQKSQSEIKYLKDIYGFSLAPIAEQTETTAPLWGQEALKSLGAFINKKSKLIEKLEANEKHAKHIKGQYKKLQADHKSLQNLADRSKELIKLRAKDKKIYNELHQRNILMTAVSIQSFQDILKVDPSNMPAIKVLVLLYQKDPEKELRELFDFIKENAANSAKHTYQLAVYFQERGNIQFANMLLASCDGKGWYHRVKAKKLLASINN